MVTVAPNTTSETETAIATYDSSAQKLTVSFPYSDGFDDMFYSCAWYLLIDDEKYFLRGIVDAWDSTDITWDATQFPFDPSVLEDALSGDTSVKLEYVPSEQSSNPYQYYYYFKSGLPLTEGLSIDVPFIR